MLIAMWIGLALATLVVALAVHRARRAREHTVIAAAVGATLLADLGRLALILWALPPAGPPLAGVAQRLAGAADDALHIAWPALIAAVALRVLAERGRGSTALVALAWAGAAVAIAMTYPAMEPLEVRAELLRKKYLAFELAASFVALACLLYRVRRFWRAKSIEPQSFTTRIASVLVAAHFAGIVVGPHQLGLFGQAWWLGIVVSMTTFTILAGLHVYALIKEVP